jgi:hypothetical protein
MMFIGKYSLKQKAARGGRVIEQKEFNKIWNQSLRSPNWAEQQKTAKMNQWGVWAERVVD